VAVAGSFTRKQIAHERFRFAALAASFPSAVRVFFGRCAIVRFRRAAFAAFLTFLRAAERCFGEAILPLLNREVDRCVI
jgi:hypothetical protein